MANAKQLPSGRWRVQYYDADGKRKSITADTKKAAEFAALEIQLKNKRTVENITVGEAIDDYINSKDAILSPTTVETYRKLRRNHFQTLEHIPLKNLTEKNVQQAFNVEAKRTSIRGEPFAPKTLANVRGLFSATMRMHGLSFSPTITPPRKQNRDLPEPLTVYNIIKDTDIELPCLLAMWLSFTMSEIRGLRVCDIKNGFVTINQVIVDVEGMPVVKSMAKEYERNRTLAVPKKIMERIERTEAWQSGEGYIVPMKASAIYNRYKRRIRKAGLDITFHDLRHINASVMVQLNIPNKYAMERGGWKTDRTMKRVYQETFSEERKRVDCKVDNYYDAVIDDV